MENNYFPEDYFVTIWSSKDIFFFFKLCLCAVLLSVDWWCLPRFTGHLNLISQDDIYIFNVN